MTKPVDLMTRYGALPGSVVGLLRSSPRVHLSHRSKKKRRSRSPSAVDLCARTEWGVALRTEDYGAFMTFTQILPVAACHKTVRFRTMEHEGAKCSVCDGGVRAIVAGEHGAVPSGAVDREARPQRRALVPGEGNWQRTGRISAGNRRSAVPETYRGRHRIGQGTVTCGSSNADGVPGLPIALRAGREIGHSDQASTGISPSVSRAILSAVWSEGLRLPRRSREIWVRSSPSCSPNCSSVRSCWPLNRASGFVSFALG